MSRVRDLAGAEVLTWRLSDIPFQASESRGPLRVSLGEEVVRLFPWYAHPHMRKGRLYIVDPRRNGAVIGEYGPASVLYETPDPT